MRDESGSFFPTVSLIMAAYNEQDHIERKILNCLALDYPENRLEIIIGSDGSDDGTDDIAKRYAGDRLAFYSHPSRRGKMAVINDGVKYATGEICVFTDVSELFDKNAIKKLVRNFKDPSIGAVTGNHLYNPSDTQLGKGTMLYWRYQRWLQRMESRLSTIMACDGTIYACRRKVFVPPPEGTINDDKAVPLGIVQQGYRIVFEPEAIARGDALPETQAFFQQKIRGQVGMYQLFWMFRKMFFPTDLKTWFIFMSHTVGPVLVPWLLITVFLTNVVLSGERNYFFLLIGQLFFYGSAGLGAYFHRRQKNVPFLHIPYFFMVSNIASFFAFWSYLFNVQKATWKKVE